MKVNRLINLLVAPALVLASFAAAPAVALAAPDHAPAAAPCYSDLRADLGTVLPSGWQGYNQATACTQAARDLAVFGLPEAAAAPLDAACFRSLHQDLGTVLPGRDPSYLRLACSKGAAANAGVD